MLNLHKDGSVISIKEEPVKSCNFEAMKTLSEISNILKTNKNQLFDSYGIEYMAIFGSYGRSEQKEESDLDILVEFKKPIGIEFIDLADELENILDIKVDLISRNGLKPKYFKAIESELVYV